MDIVLNLTRRCNLCCTYCTVDKCAGTMTDEIASKAIELAYSEGRSHTIGFYGGEPLLEFDLMKRIVADAERKLPEGHRLSFKITDNCTLLDKEVLDFMVEHGFSLAVSYDGFDQAANRRFADGSPSVFAVEKNLQAIASLMPESVVMLTVTPDTVRHIPANLRLISGMGFRRISINLDNTASDWDWEELEESLLKISETVHEKGLSIIQFDNILRSAGSTDKGACSPGKGEICVDTDGTLYPCITFLGEKEYAVGNIVTGIDSRKLTPIHDASCRIPEKCIGCKHAKYCRIQCICRRFRSTGNIETFSEIECKKIQTFAEACSGMQYTPNPGKTLFVFIIPDIDENQDCETTLAEYNRYLSDLAKE